MGRTFRGEDRKRFKKEYVKFRKERQTKRNPEEAKKRREAQEREEGYEE